MTYEPKSNRAYVCNDEKPELWVIDPEAKKIVATLALSGAGMEDLAFNADGTFLFHSPGRSVSYTAGHTAHQQSSGRCQHVLHGRTRPVH